MKTTLRFAVVTCLLVTLTACGVPVQPGDTASKESGTPSTSETTRMEDQIPQTVSNGPENSPAETPGTPEELPNSPAGPPVPTPPASKPNEPLAAPATLDTARNAWWYTKNSTHSTPVIPGKISKLIKQYKGYYTGSTSAKAIYLTFDEGYENGYTSSILDTLKAHKIKATFFVTESYITKNKALIQRMVAEGHVVANHTVTHRSMNELSEKELQNELKGVETAFNNATGRTLYKYVRPPKGDYSEKSLWITRQLGYKTIFWSIAYRDWDTANQPTPEQTMAAINDNLHNGAIILLHAVSKTNTEKLAEILQLIAAKGYEFRLITNL